MPEWMNAVALTGLRRIEIVRRPVPAPAAGQALIHIQHIGICGSDLHYYLEGRSGDNPVPFPMVLGHEGSGTVVDVGDGVSKDLVGKRVCMEPQVSCGHCRWCREGRYNLCPQVYFMGAAPNDGCMTEYVVFPADRLVELPEGMSTLEGAMAEPMSVGFHAALRSGAALPGRRALVIGAGCIGLCSALALRKMGLTEIHQTEPLAMRREKARALGSIVHDPNEESNEDLMRASGGEGFDLVIECAGEEDTPAQAVELCRRGGSVTLVSMPSQLSLPFPTIKVVRKELDVHGLFRYRNQYAAVTEMIAEGLPVRDIVSHTYPLEKAAEAFAFNTEHKDQCVKIVLEV